jgi:hypothetical protein
MDAATAAYEELCPPDLSAAVAPDVPELLAALAERPGELRHRPASTLCRLP